MGYLVHRIHLVIRACLTALVTMTAILVLPSPAHAECSWSGGGKSINGMVQLHATYQCDRGSVTDTKSIANPVRDSDWDANCVRTAITVSLDPAEFCDVPPDAP